MELDRRLELSKILHEYCDHVYFQPPSSLKMEYPCIVYKRGRMEPIHADNVIHKLFQVYDLTYITRDADDATHEELIRLPYCSPVGTPYTVENLYHTPLQIYY